ncbi:MAG: sulfotransferase domain-containing protein [Gammaproteobacteria bacterium]
MTEKRRARSLAELGEKLGGMFDDEVRAKGLATELRPTDIVVTPYGKSGTTWTQQIVHTLRTRGDMEFDDISRVVPWLEVSAALGIDLNAKQKANPRAFKSHLAWDDMPRGGKYINVVREPAATAISMFRFQEGWFLEPGAMTADEFVMGTFVASRAYFQHLKSWWARRNDADVLFLVYEEMLADPAAAIQKIASFMGIDLDAELLALTLRHTSREFMLQHQDKFDDSMLRQLSEDVADLPRGSASAKVTSGSSTSLLSDNTLEAIALVWQEEITTSLGFDTYQDLLAARSLEA